MRGKNFWKQWHDYLYPALAPLVALVLFPIISLTGLFERMENSTIDWRFRVRAPYDPPPDPRLILVQIDQSSLDSFGAWPWDRSRHADFCQLLAAADPAVIAFDILFIDKSGPDVESPAPDKNKKGQAKTDPNPPFDDDLSAYQEIDKELGDSIGKSGVVITGAMLSEDTLPPVKVNGKVVAATPPNLYRTQPLTGIEGDISQLKGADSAHYPILPVRQSSLFGFVDVEASADGMRRGVPMVVRVGHDVFATLSLQILCQFWNLTPDQIHVRLGREVELDTPEGIKKIPIDNQGLMLVNYRNEATFRGLPYAGLTVALYHHFVDNPPKPMPSDYPSLEGKIFLVGQTQPGLSDMGPSPYGPISPLVMVHMNAINNILRNDYLRKVPLTLSIPAWLAMSWGTLFYLRRKSPTNSVIIPVALMAAYIAIATAVFSAKSLALPLVWPITLFAAIHFGAIVLRWLEEMRSKLQIRNVFSTYIAPSVLNQLLAHPENIQLGGVSKPVTILFSDIRGFTTLTENMGNQELVLQLNEYFEKMVDCLNRYRGTHHKYIGDAVMAVWGDVLPEKPEIDAANAVRAAIAMRAELVGLNEFWSAANRPNFKIGVGLNHGTVVVGNIGAKQKREFTVIGDPVNLASRLEGITKEYKTDIAIGETVHALVRDEFLMRTIGLIQVKGKTHPVRVYDVLDDLKQPSGKWSAEWVARYEKGIEAYLARRFEEAIGLFEKGLAEHEGDYCSKLYIKLSREFILHPPPADWDGTQVMETK